MTNNRPRYGVRADHEKRRYQTSKHIDGEYTLYGEFKSEQEFKAELPNIRYLGLYMKRRNIRK